MNFKTAVELFKSQWRKKESSPLKECVFPYNINYENDEFIKTQVTIENCLTQDIDHDLVNKYIKAIKKGVDLGPSWVIYGKRLKSGQVIPFWHKKLYVLDGNHRLASKQQCGAKNVDVIIPHSNYELYGINK